MVFSIISVTKYVKHVKDLICKFLCTNIKLTMSIAMPLPIIERDNQVKSKLKKNLVTLTLALMEIIMTDSYYISICC